jgi:MFS family permease
MVGVAMGWELFKLTNDPFALGLVGLVQVLPVILLSLPAGTVADRFNRKRVVAVAQSLAALSSLGLVILSATQPALEPGRYLTFSEGTIPLYYLCLLGIGVSRAFNLPASNTLLPMTVPPEHFTNAATYSSSAWQLAAILGPALGGFAIALFKTTWQIYLFDVFAALGFALLVNLMQVKHKPRPREPVTLATLSAGARFVFQKKVILAAITLDMFAVLLGGATALLPVFAEEILKVGPVGLGWLRAMPSIGALLMAIFLTRLPPFERAGLTLLWAVVGFGAATLVFGLSVSFPLSLLMLFVLGALDQISVIIRSTLVLTQTPDAMRGRVSAVNSMFIGISNELGAFESGVAARFLGTIGAVVFGGIGTIVVVGLISWFWPEVRQLGRLDPDPELKESEQGAPTSA